MENLFPKWKINLPNGKFISQMENQFRKWKINFANGKFISQMENQFPEWKIYFPNGKSISQMANLISQMENKFSKWKLFFSNGKLISQMAKLFPKWKIHFPSGKFYFRRVPPTPSPFFSKVMTYQFFNPLRSRGQIAQWQSRRLPRERHRFESGLSPDRLEVWWYGGGGYWAI